MPSIEWHYIYSTGEGDWNAARVPDGDLRQRPENISRHLSILKGSGYRVITVDHPQGFGILIDAMYGLWGLYVAIIVDD